LPPREQLESVDTLVKEEFVTAENFDSSRFSILQECGFNGRINRIAYPFSALQLNAFTMKPEQQARFQAAADKAMDENTARFNKQEGDVLEYFKKEGKKVYEPDQNAFRAYAQKKYVEKYGNDWPKGALERINAIR
jgi:hypothetical protein